MVKQKKGIIPKPIRKDKKKHEKKSMRKSNYKAFQRKDAKTKFDKATQQDHTTQ